ncbi:MAG TPA: hypothetical protein VFT24_10170 [Vicinamibacterales bacterium]|nr:hypothetical protein [Vicinamibacterales bacterium]
MILSCGQISALVTKIQGDYLDTPGLTLTLPEALKRFGANAITCKAVLDTLVDARVLTRTSDGGFVRFFPRCAARPYRAA